MALERWHEAVDIANEFLRSPWCRTLPRGCFELGEDGMTYRNEAGRSWPIEVCSTSWGDLVVTWGFVAQEGQRGFSVGNSRRFRDALPDPEIDNTFFRHPNGFWLDSEAIAELTLHETTHVVFRKGTVGFWNTLVYYVVAVTTFRGVDHPAEDRPHATSEEFAWFHSAKLSGDSARQRLLQAFEEHVAAKHAHCEHGPFADAP